jgi:C-terminal processing protease CtpA/Prc
VGWYTNRGQNLENYGVPPDIRAPEGPLDELKKDDVQLKRAVQELLAELKQQQSTTPAR